MKQPGPQIERHTTHKKIRKETNTRNFFFVFYTPLSTVWVAESHKLFYYLRLYSGNCVQCRGGYIDLNTTTHKRERERETLRVIRSPPPLLVLERERAKKH
jgi:hypothetical protein